MNPTGSSLERAVQCPASFAFPQCKSTTEASMQGTKNHAAVEEAIMSGNLDMQPQVVREAMEGAISASTEVTYIIDVEQETARLFGRGVNREYGNLLTSEIALTLDAQILRPDGMWWVWDWKSRSRVADAADNLQLRAACVAVMKVHALHTVTGAIGYLNDSESSVASFLAEEDFGPFFELMRGMLGKIERAEAILDSGGVNNVHTGPWCTYCPAVPHCPAQINLARAMADLAVLDAPITPAEAGYAWLRLKKIQAMAETIEASLRLIAKQNPLPLPGGKRLTMVPSQRSSPDAKGALARLKEHGLPTDDLYRTHYFDVAREK